MDTSDRKANQPSAEPTDDAANAVLALHFDMNAKLDRVCNDGHLHQVAERRSTFAIWDVAVEALGKGAAILSNGHQRQKGQPAVGGADRSCRPSVAEPTVPIAEADRTVDLRDLIISTDAPVGYQKRLMTCSEGCFGNTSMWERSQEQK